MVHSKKSMTDLHRPSAEQMHDAGKWPVTIVLDNVRSLHNVGSVFRTSDAFRVQQLVLCGITGSPPHKELHKTALGATETVAWQYETDASAAVTRLKAAGFHICCVEQVHGSIGLHQFSPVFPLALVFGNEVSGVCSQVLALADSFVEIPQFGAKHSFNVAVSAGMVLWQLWAAGQR